MFSMTATPCGCGSRRSSRSRAARKELAAPRPARDLRLLLPRRERADVPPLSVLRHLTQCLVHYRQEVAEPFRRVVPHVADPDGALSQRSIAFAEGIPPGGYRRDNLRALEVFRQADGRDGFGTTVLSRENPEFMATASLGTSHPLRHDCGHG